MNRDIFLWGNLIHSAITAPGPLADLSPRERRAQSDTLLLNVSPKNKKQQTLFALLNIHYSFGLEVNFKQRQIIAEKHLIVLMHTYLLNTAALWYCLCCLDLVLFVDLFSLTCFLSFNFVSVCVWNNAIFGNGWHAWMGLGDIFGLYWFFGVCPCGWGRTCICHSCHSHTHACPCEEWAALSPLLFSETFFDKIGIRDTFSFSI